MKLLKKKIILIPLIVLASVILLGAFSIIGATRGLEEVRKTTLENVDLSIIPNGVYTGSFNEYRWQCTVDVTVANHVITAIKITGGNTFLTEDRIQELIGNVLEDQSANTDVVSGATVSSKAFLKAVENALKSAIN